MKKIQFIIAIIGISVLTNCKKMIETKPPGELIAEEAIKTENDLQKLLTNAYSETAALFGGFGQTCTEFMADNLRNPNNNDYREIYNHNVLFFSETMKGLYGNVYRAIFRANFTEKNFVNAKDLTPTNKDRMLGEIKFLRALLHFYAVRNFAQPFGFTSDNSHPGIAYAAFAENITLNRLSVAESYKKIIADAEDAINLLPTSNGNYATKSAAQALLAQIYFQMGNYDKAGEMANIVITTSSKILSDTTNPYHPKSYKEHLFSIVSTAPNDNRSGAFNGNYANSNPLCQMDFISYGLLDDSLDYRFKRNFRKTDPNTPKQTIVNDMFNGQFFNVPLITLTEMHLVRAESYAKRGLNLTIAIGDINTIITRAYKNLNRTLLSSATATQIIDETRYQRRRELLFTGDRFYEIKRLGAIEGKDISVRGHRWNCSGFVLQFPGAERTNKFEINPTGGCQ